MNENEMKAFRMAIKVYSKWRETVIETDEQWRELAADVGLYVAATDVDYNPLAGHLITAILETINDLYKGGMKPMPAGYFGRDDL